MEKGVIAMSSRDPRDWMWTEACEFIERAERLHRQFFRPATQPAQYPAWEPPFDMYETAEALWLVVALPGVPPERLDVRLDSTAMVIAGLRPLPEFPRSAVLHRLEIPAGRFRLENHELVHGCLVLALRKIA
jgi:HSP20 family molecular chaperone IbpA